MALPMPDPTVPALPLTDYKVLSFDVYGSLVEYKGHILTSFQPLLSRLPPSSPYLDATPLSTTIPNSASVGSVEFLKVFQRQEDAIKLEKPTKQFDQILSEIWRRIAKELNVDSTEEEARRFGSDENIASWPTFPGTLEALKSLSKRYKLVALSNIDKYAWSITSSSPTSRLGEIDWWKVFTAEDFGDDAKRADEIKLETLIEYCAEKGVEKKEILHVAQSLGHDQAPAKRLGLSSVWLIGDGPRWGKEAESKMALDKKLVGYAWRFHNLKELAEDVERTVKEQRYRDFEQQFDK
ncbi:hypothetical protein PV11_06836 [Exophiala sideris]|uniref:Haloacid dehalogenase, type II n=1 Tax=Exophiala sideris TaxID=1016849 RepID=A0A0D1YWS2_9EURO|nr:hypothetical protein PV11_06836 [Exophiala sideris]